MHVRRLHGKLSGCFDKSFEPVSPSHRTDVAHKKFLFDAEFFAHRSKISGRLKQISLDSVLNYRDLLGSNRPVLDEMIFERRSNHDNAIGPAV